MMRSPYLAVAMLGLFGFAGPSAAASPLIQEFERFCLAGNLTPAEVHDLARAQGYVAPPAQMVEKAPAPFNQADLLWKAREGGAILLVAAENVPKATVYPSRLCAMALVPGSASDVSDFEKLIGFSPIKTGFRDVYVFKETEGRRIPASAAESTSTELTKGNHVTAGGFYEGGASIYVIARPLKPTAPSR